MNQRLDWRVLLRRLSWAASFLVVLAVACTTDEPPLAKLAQGCSINSDCDAPLVCAFQRCHNACESTRDCAPGLRCVASDGPLHVCQLEEERTCLYNSDCPDGQVCGSDAQCRDMCMGEADCLKEQLCVSGTCAEPSELRDGGLPVVTKDSGPSTGQPCTYNTECPERLVCRTGLCQLECLSTVDCSEGRQCIENRCLNPLCPEVDAGSGIACAFNSDCPGGLICKSGSCTCECRVSADCPVGYDCASARCTPTRIDSIGPEGGIVVSPDRRLTLEVPAGALALRVHLTIDLAEAWPAGALGPVFEVRPSGTTFAKPATLVYRYQAGDIAPVAPAELRMAVAVGPNWSALPTTVDAATNVVTAQTTHLSTYGLIRANQLPDAGPPDVSAPPDADASLATDATLDVADVTMRGVEAGRD